MYFLVRSFYRPYDTQNTNTPDVVEIHEVVDGNDRDVWVGESRSENHAADAAEAIDSNLAGGHC